MRCPRCGYDFNNAILEVGFHKCDYHPDMKCEIWQPNPVWKHIEGELYIKEE